MRYGAAALVALLPSTLVAQDDDVRKTVEAALARHDRTAALAALEAVVEPGAPRDRRRSVEAAKTAMDVVKGADGDLLAARILLDTLTGDRRDTGGAYKLAMDLKARVFDVDLPAAQELLQGLVRIYPGELKFAYELATTLRHEGNVQEAGDEYARIAQTAPSERDARSWLVSLYEQRGDVERAIGVLDELIDLHARDPRPDLRAHLSKARLLLWSAHDVDAAKKALDAGEAAVAAYPPGTERDELADQFRSMRVEVANVESARTTLRELRARIHGVLWATGFCWALVLGGGLALLRRRDWI